MTLAFDLFERVQHSVGVMLAYFIGYIALGLLFLFLLVMADTVADSIRRWRLERESRHAVMPREAPGIIPIGPRDRRAKPRQTSAGAAS